MKNILHTSVNILPQAQRKIIQDKNSMSLITKFLYNMAADIHRFHHKKKRFVIFLADCDDDLIDIPARTDRDQNLNLSPLAGTLIGLGFLLALPFALGLTGGLIWWRRRRM